jgi:hypothetical protein
MAGWAKPVRSSPLGVTDRWAQAVSPTFYFDLIWFDSKTLKKNPNLFKNKSRKIPKIN